MSNELLLGEIVTWDVLDSETPFDKIKRALLDSGLSTDVLSDLQPKAAFLRACRTLKKDRAIDKVEQGPDSIRFQFTHKTIQEGRADYEYECLVLLDTKSGLAACPEDPSKEPEINNLITRAMGTRTSQDITRLVQGMFTKNADLYPINPRKGVAYFVPEKHRSFTAQVEDFLKRVGGAMSRFPVPKGTAEGNASVRDAVSSGLTSLIQELDQVVDTWDENTRKGTMEKMVEKYRIVEYKISAYSEYLNERQAELQKNLEARKQKLAEKIEQSFSESLVDQPVAAA